MCVCVCVCVCVCNFKLTFTAPVTWKLPVPSVAEAILHATPDQLHLDSIFSPYTGYVQSACSSVDYRCDMNRLFLA